MIAGVDTSLIEHVMVVWTDNCNITRTKVIPFSRLDNVAKDGVAATAAILSLPMMHDVVSNGDSPSGDVRLMLYSH
jgi:hypothetical protein